MNYKKELNKLRKHRKQYHPIMTMLMNLYNHSKPSDFPVELIDKKEILIILELLDIGYLDENAMIIKRRFDDITSLKYTGEYPFTDGGDFFFQQNRGNIKRMINIFRKLLNHAHIRSQ